MAMRSELAIWGEVHFIGYLIGILSEFFFFLSLHFYSSSFFLLSKRDTTQTSTI